MPTAVEAKMSMGTHSDYFLKIGEIKGESQDSSHKGELDLVSWSFGAEQPAASAIGSGGAGAGKVRFHDLVITKHMDSASPKLMLACASGQHFPDVTLVCRRAGGKQSEYLKIELKNVIISSYQSSSDDWDTQASQKFTFPVDKISLNFAKIQFHYKAQNPDGTEGPNTQAGWDLQANQKV